MKSQKERIKQLLSDGQWHSFRELNDICFRYGGRLYELKSEGVNFEKKKIGKVFFYRIPRAKQEPLLKVGQSWML